MMLVDNIGETPVTPTVAKTEQRILAGDVGGTKATLAIFDADGKVLAQATYPSQQHSSLNEIVHKFVATYPCQVTSACFGVACPIQNGRCETTNLPWIVDAQELAADLSLATVGLINDLEANAYGITMLKPTDLLTLNTGQQDAFGNAAVISAGTGLGEAGIYWNGEQYRPFACEGGHANFAPSNEMQLALLQYLMQKFDHVSWERVLSGPGIYNIYQFLRDVGFEQEPQWLAEQVHQQDPAPVITQAALAGKSSLCSHTLDLFITLYGSEAGNLALKLMATGGVYIGGGIVPKILPRFQASTFMAAFTAKGPMRSLLQSIPVHVILNDKTALLGAARWAAGQHGAES